MLELSGSLPGRVIACVGGGSNAIGTFVPFLEDEDVELIGVEAGGEGLDSGRHGAPLTTGARGILHGALSAVLQDDDGRWREEDALTPSRARTERLYPQPDNTLGGRPSGGTISSSIRPTTSSTSRPNKPLDADV